jgi:hypothetical protein
MAKTKISEFDTNPDNNTDINSINIAEGCAPSGINNAIRQLMSDLKEFQTGAASDPLTVGGVATFTAGTASAPAITTTGDTNTGIFFPAADTIAFAEGGAEAMRLDSSGNLGLGVTPSAWSTNKAIQLPDIGFYGSTGPYVQMIANAYYNGTNYTRITANQATMYAQAVGQHQWHTVGSSTAGSTFTFTQAMTLDASGNLLVGTTSSSGVSGAAFKKGAATSCLIEISGGNGTPATDSLAVGQDASNVGYVYQRANQALIFGTNNTERMRINSSGDLLVNTTSSFGGVRGVVTSQGIVGVAYAYVSYSSGTDENGQIAFINPNGVVGGINTNGSSTSYITSSDYRLKENIAPMTGALATVSALKPVTYNWKVDGSSGQGFIAHELAEVVPDAVTGEKDAVNADGSIKPQGIDTSFLVATLTAAIQEQQAIITQLQADVATLKGTV